MAGNTGRAAGRIVVGVDGTAASLTAVYWAAREALLRHAGVHLVFVRNRGTRASYAGMPEVSPPDGDADARALLTVAELEAGRILPPGRLSSELADGLPAKVLIDRSAGAGMLVLGAACRAGQSAGEAPPLVGPVARACLYGAECPVLVLATPCGASKSACIYPASDAVLAAPPTVVWCLVSRDARTGSEADVLTAAGTDAARRARQMGHEIRSRAEDTRARTLEVAAKFAATEDRVAATFGQLAATHPQESARYQTISQAASGIAVRTRQWVEAHAATG